MVSTEAIEGVKSVVALTDRVKRGKEAYLSAVPHLSSERSHLVTESYKETEGEPLDIRRGKMFKRMMEGLPVVIRENELIVGSQTKYVRGASPAVDFNPEHTLELFKDNKITLSSLVKAAAVSEEEKATLIEDALYWKGKSPYDAAVRLRREAFGTIVDELEAARVCVGPLARPVYSRLPDYGKVLAKGLRGIITEAKEAIQQLRFTDREDVSKHYFLQGVIIGCEGAIAFAHRYAALAREMAEKENNPERKKELERIAENCQWVPENPARNFYEALQSFWLTFLCVNLETAYSNEAPGRMDQYLYPFYKKDLDEGRTSRQDAAELLGCVWVKLAEMDNVRGSVQKQASQANQTQDVTIGGVTKEGKDASNELTYLLLEVLRQLKTHQPPVYLRVHKGTPPELMMMAMEVNRDRGDGMPAFLNDEAVLLNLVGKDIPLDAARDWAATACVKPEISHASAAGLSYIMSLAKVLELTLHNGVDPLTGKQLGPKTGEGKDFSSFEELYEAYKKQVDFFVDIFSRSHALVWQVLAEYTSAPFFSGLTDDCIKKGKGYMTGGVRYPQIYFGVRERGIQDVADSLAALKKVVFEDKKATMPEVLDALASNFAEKEKLRQLLLAAPKYGNDDDYADDIFNDLSMWGQRRIYEEKHIMGPFGMTTNRSGATFHTYFGKQVGALPNGRKAYEGLADGSMSPVQGMDTHGPTAAINSATKINHTEICRATLFNLKFSPSMVQTRDGLKKLGALTKSYFDRGGYHIQYNLLGQDVLVSAKKNPEKYRDLLVRVAGYSAYFVDLSSEVQDEIIKRTEHAL